MRVQLTLLLLFFCLLSVVSCGQAPELLHSCKFHPGSESASSSCFAARNQVSAIFSPVRIDYQALFIRLDPDQRYISGSVHYRLRLTESRPQLAVDLDQALQVDSVWTTRGPLSFQQTDLQLLLPAPSGNTHWPADSLLDFHVRYAGIPPVNPNGFGSFMTARHGPDSVPVLWTLSQPYGCRDWWPAFQSLGIKADSTHLSVDIPLGYRVGGPGLLAGIDTLGNRVTYHWQHHYALPPYLLGLAVSEYEVLEQWIPIAGSSDTIYVVNYVYTEDTAYAYPRLRELLPPMFQRFHDRFGPYPYLREKYGHMQISIFSGGMEHSTMSSMGSWDYSLMVHELAHQWFGNKITCASWRDIWVNEGFATWTVSLCLEDLLDNGFWWPGWKTLTRLSALRVPDGSIYVTDTVLTSTIFAQRLSYHKASFVLHALRYQLGDSALFAGLYAFMNDPQLSWAFATTEHIRSFLEAASGRDLRGYFDRYIYGSGYPTYQFNWQQRDNELRLHTRQISPDPRTLPFALRLPLRVYGSGGLDSLDISIDFRGPALSSRHVVPFPIDSLRFDPNTDILSFPAVVQRLSDPTDAPAFYAVREAGRLLLNLPFAWGEAPLVLRMYDMRGQLQLETQLPFAELYPVIDLPPALSDGLYTLVLQRADTGARLSKRLQISDWDF